MTLFLLRYLRRRRPHPELREARHIFPGHGGLALLEAKLGPNGNVTSRSESSSRFTRSVAMPEPVLPDKVESRYEGGVLRIELPKKFVDT